MTDCGHSYCEKCLLNHTGGRPTWRCPVSRRAHTRRVQLLPRNFAIESFVESIKPKKAKALTITIAENKRKEEIQGE